MVLKEDSPKKGQYHILFKPHVPNINRYSEPCRCNIQRLHTQQIQCKGQLRTESIRRRQHTGSRFILEKVLRIEDSEGKVIQRITMV